MRRKGQEASVYVAMRYWKPFTEDAIEQVRSAGHVQPERSHLSAPEESVKCGSPVTPDEVSVLDFGQSAV